MSTTQIWMVCGCFLGITLAALEAGACYVAGTKLCGTLTHNCSIYCYKDCSIAEAPYEQYEIPWAQESASGQTLSTNTPIPYPCVAWWECMNSTVPCGSLGNMRVCDWNDISYYQWQYGSVPTGSACG
jgi:hypothetical protein